MLRSYSARALCASVGVAAAGPSMKLPILLRAVKLALRSLLLPILPDRRVRVPAASSGICKCDVSCSSATVVICVGFGCEANNCSTFGAWGAEVLRLRPVFEASPPSLPPSNAVERAVGRADVEGSLLIRMEEGL